MAYLKLKSKKLEGNRREIRAYAYDSQVVGGRKAWWLAVPLIWLLAIWVHAQGLNPTPAIALSPTKSKDLSKPGETITTLPLKRPIRRVSRSPLEFESHWTHCGEKETNTRYKYFQEMENPEEGGAPIRKEFIQRTRDKKPLLFYEHERGITFTLGHQDRLVLINDSPASKSNHVVIADLGKNENYRVDEESLDRYSKEVLAKAPAEDLKEVSPWVLATGIGFSPKDEKVLIEVASLIMGPGYPAEERLSKILKERYYVVDPKDGKVLGAYRTKNVPKDWWELNKHSALVAKEK